MASKKIIDIKNKVEKKKKFDELVKKSREAVFPGQTLCKIEFSNDGGSTNDFIPNKILKDSSISNADWWNEKNKDTYIPLVLGQFKAVKASPLED